MEFRFTAKCNGVQETFCDEERYYASIDAKDWVRGEAMCSAFRLQKSGEYAKAVIHSAKNFIREVKFYEYLKETGITPELLRTGKLFPFQIVEEGTENISEGEYSYIVLERFGNSLDKIYAVTDGIISSEDLLTNEEMFDNTFSPSKFPEKVRENIRSLLKRLSEAGVEHLDFHSGNILMDEKGQLKVIDFERAAFL